MVKPAVTAQEVVKEEKKVEKSKPRDLSDDEKVQIMMRGDFQKFFDRATRITERALYTNEAPDIFIDYAGAKEEVEG